VGRVRTEASSLSCRLACLSEAGRHGHGSARSRSRRCGQVKFRRL